MEGVERVIMIKREDIDDNILISLNKRNENWQIVEDIKNDLNTQKEDYANYQNDNSLKIATIEKSLNDYKSTMASVNVNQEAKQTASGYGTVSLPKNAANGQVGVSIKGNTVTDEDGTKSTQSAMRLKSVGKNLFDGQVELGSIDTGTGAGVNSGVFTRSKNFIPILPSREYKGSLIVPSSQNVILFYDGNKQYISFVSSLPFSFTTPANCRYIKIRLNTNGVLDKKIQINEGTAATPYEPYTESTQYLPNVGELRSLPNGVCDEIRVSGGKAELIKRVSDEFIFSQLNWTVYSLGESADFYAVQTVEVPVPNGYLLNQFNIVNYPSLYTGDLAIFQTTNSFIFRTHENNLRIKIPKSEISGTVDNAKIKVWFQSKGVRLTYQLAEPIITPINASGNIVSNPSGTVYIEPAVADAGMYTTKLNVLNTDLPINYIEKLSKVDFNTGVETELDSSKCVIAEDKLSFTHPDLTANDIVFFTYYHNLETTQGETTIEYYDSRHTLKDSVTGKFYKVVPAVANGVLVNELVEA